MDLAVRTTAAMASDDLLYPDNLKLGRQQVCIRNPRAMFLFRTSYFSRSSVERLFNWAHVDNNIICSLYRFSDKRGRDSGRKPEEIVQKIIQGVLQTLVELEAFYQQPIRRVRRIPDSVPSL